MVNKIERLKSLDNEKLVDVVKNYRQYDYDDNLRNAAIGILDDRGIDIKQLELTGNFENETYNSAEKIYNLFKRNSLIVVICYLLIVITSILLPIFSLDSEPLRLLTLSIDSIAIFVYLVFLIKSFINQIDFFKLIGKYPGSGLAAIYFIIGIPLFIFLNFFYRNRMNEELKMIK